MLVVRHQRFSHYESVDLELSRVIKYHTLSSANRFVFLFETMQVLLQKSFVRQMCFKLCIGMESGAFREDKVQGKKWRDFHFVTLLLHFI